MAACVNNKELRKEFVITFKKHPLTEILLPVFQTLNFSNRAKSSYIAVLRLVHLFNPIEQMFTRRQVAGANTDFGRLPVSNCLVLSTFQS